MCLWASVTRVRHLVFEVVSLDWALAETMIASDIPRWLAVTRSGTASEVLPQTLSAARDQGGPEGPPLRAVTLAAPHARRCEAER